jgi:glycosyltransferase involved in cell wall biosynthesis
MDLKRLLTIVIPCKNENQIIDKTLSLLNFQKNIQGTKIIVADISDDETTYQLESRQNDLFDLEIIQGGLPSRARNNGAKLAKTPYILFLDADIFIMDEMLLTNAIEKIKNNDIDLLTAKFRTTSGEYNYVFKTFDIIQRLIRPFTPFCLGGFMLVKRSVFIYYKGFDEEAKVAEDYLFSKKIKPKRFYIINSVIYTPPRRFKNKGMRYMVKLMIQSFLNRNNREFFINGNKYWE